MNVRVVNNISHKAKCGVNVIRRLANLRYYFLLRESELFDPCWYSKFPKGYLGKRLPVLHYLISGAPRGRDPSLRFSGEKYLKQNPMVRESGTNPLAHYLLRGKEEGPREYSRFNEPLKETLSLLDVTPQEFQLLPETVDIIIPVFNGAHHLPPLFDSIFANTISPHRFIIVDDDSTDPAIWPYLRERAADRDDCVLIRNPEDLGFSGAVNVAAGECKGHFVVLNTDTVVPRYWLERLMRPIIEDGNIACTTPFSNAAQIFSFPLAAEDNPLLSSDIESVDSCFRALRPLLGPGNDAPTGGGFCLGINGDIWRRIGGFDQDTFGRGHAEENDWRQRAIGHGHRCVLVQNLFVAHHHGGSFDGPTRNKLLPRNLETLYERWPNYLASVKDHIRSGKWSGYRNAAFLAFCLSPAARPLVIIDAEMGGGANLYSDKHTGEALQESRSVISLRYDANLRCIKVVAAYRDCLMNFSLSDENELLSLLPVGRAETILVNELVSWESPETVLEIVVKLKSAWSARLELAVHDFFPLCPSVNLLDAGGNYCRLPSAPLCRKCLPANKHSFGKRSDIGHWRKSWGTFLASVDKVSCFSHSAFALMERAYPQVGPKSIIRPHEPTVTFPPGAYRAEAQNQLVIGVVGAISSRHKGSQIVHDLALILKKRHPGARVVVVGELKPESRQSNVKETGKYSREDLPGILNNHKINVVLLPSIWPETFSYVTQEVISLGCPVVCFDLGGQAEQVKKYSLGRIAPEVTAESALVAIEALMSEITRLGK